MSSFIGIFIDIFRQLLWWLMEFAFMITDAMFDACKIIAGVNVFTDVANAMDYYTAFCTAFLGFFIMMRLMTRYVKSLGSEEEAQTLDPLKIIIRIGAAGLVLLLAPTIMKTFGNLLHTLVINIESTLGSETNFSNFLISLGGNGDSVTVQTITEAGINAKTEEFMSSTYLYFNETSNLLLTFVASIFSCYLMFMVAIQLGGRILSIIMKLIVAPWSISSLVEEKAEQYSTWAKLMIADLMANYLQLALLMLGCTTAMGIDYTSILEGASDIVISLAKLLTLIGCLAAVLNAPSGLSQLIGADLGIGSALQSLQTTSIAMGGLGSVMRLGGNAFNGAMYGAGRLMGGASVGSILGDSGGGAGGAPGGFTGDGNIVSERSMGGAIGQAFSEFNNAQETGQSPLGAAIGGLFTGGIPNVAKAFSSLNSSSGSVGNILSNPSYNPLQKAGRLVSKGVGWGAGRAYTSAVNHRYQQQMNKRPNYVARAQHQNGGKQ
ncbi:MAG: hypothetical protein Q4D29_12365 [Lachnospiraceae bacterium]|nr:hypothetical protein [Lachnospiraceae bacterium]